MGNSSCTGSGMGGKVLGAGAGLGSSGRGGGAMGVSIFGTITGERRMGCSFAAFCTSWAAAAAASGLGFGAWARAAEKVLYSSGVMVR